MVSRVNSKYCFKESNDKALIDSNDNITKDLPVKPKREVIKAISNNFIDYWNTNVAKIGDKKFVKKMADEDIGWNNLVEFNPQSDEFDTFVKKLDSYGVKSDEDSSIFSKYNNFRLVSLNSIFSEQVVLAMPMYDCKGEYPFKFRVYESPKLERIYINIVFHFYDDKTANIRLMAMGDGIILRNLVVSKSKVERAYKQSVRSLDVYFDIVSEEEPYTKYGYGDKDVFPFLMFRPQVHSVPSKVDLKESYDRFEVITGEFWKKNDIDICRVRY